MSTDTTNTIVIVLALATGGFGGYVAAKKETMQDCAKTGQAPLVWGVTIKCEFLKDRP